MENIEKKAYDEALKDIEQEKKEKIKEIIKRTLEKKTNLEAEVRQLQKEIKILNRDIEDFKKGRLDLIEERQNVDELAKKTSVVEIIRIIEKHCEKPRYEPYKIIPCPPCLPYNPTPWITWQDGSSYDNVGGNGCGTDLSMKFTGSDFYHTTAGTYDINGSIFNL